MKLSGKTIWISGRDRRLEYLRDLLVQKGNIVYYEPTLSSIQKAEGLKRCEILLSGIPFDSQCTVNLSCFSKLRWVFGGLPGRETLACCKEMGLCFYDYMKNEALTVYNAIATAEGVITEAICALSENLSESRCLILGYGRCARQLAKMLKALGTNLTISARNPALSEEITGLGMSFFPLERLSLALSEQNLIVNTIPAQILNESLLRHIDSDSQVFDIASAPGGIDKAAALALGVHVKNLPGLPGKYAPKASAKAIFSCLEQNIPEFPNNKIFHGGLHAAEK